MIGKGKVRQYLLYAIGEILLVMIGILLAIRVNNINEAKIERREEVKFYENFKRQITEDRDVIQSTIAYNNGYMRQFQYAVQILSANDRSRIDTLGIIASELSKYSDFDRPGNIYQSIVNSGKINLLDNETIVEKIQILEETYNYFNRMENIHYDMVTSVVPELITLINYADRKAQDPEKLYDFRMQNIFIIAMGIMQEKDEIYKRAIRQIEEIIRLIDEEL